MHTTILTNKNLNSLNLNQNLKWYPTIIEMLIEMLLNTIKINEALSKIKTAHSNK